MARLSVSPARCTTSRAKFQLPLIPQKGMHPSWKRGKLRQGKGGPPRGSTLHPKCELLCRAKKKALERMLQGTVKKR